MSKQVRDYMVLSSVQDVHRSHHNSSQHATPRLQEAEETLLDYEEEEHEEKAGAGVATEGDASKK